MPIARTYQCTECFHRLEVILSSEQWNDPPPDCPLCAQQQMQQQFKPFSIGNTPTAQANAIAEKIAAEDYHVADMNRDHRLESTPKTRYKDPGSDRSTWGVANEALQQAVALGRQTRLQHGSGLDILQANLKSGVERDLIADSKKRMIRLT